MKDLKPTHPQISDGGIGSIIERLQSKQIKEAKKHNIKLFCIIKAGNILAGLLDVLFLGRAKDIAGFIAIRLLGKQSCGCLERQRYLNELFGCEDGIKL